ncbi:MULTISPECIES: alpha/beta hydrolase [Anaerolinea]|uniref:alpha/beta hydrolase n=1 Tax=Anaerolinea TaxID=233189 RepID=UPI0026366E3C|nr:alpha/beta fold hydrolase [Anaerolinea thermophila]
MRRIIRWILFLSLTLLLVWSGGILFLSQRYVQRLLHPPCLDQITTQPDRFLNQSIPLPSGNSLRAWWHPPQNGLAVLLIGGHGSSRDNLMWEADVFARHGFGALLIDSRVCRGMPATLGVRESEDAQAALDWLQNQPGVKQIAVFGFSAGGVAGLRLAVRNPQVAAVITAGNYPSLQEEVLETPAAEPFSLRWQIQQGVALLLELYLGMPLSRVRPVEDLEKITPRPVLLIFGEKEARETRALDQYHAAGEPKMLWIVPGADHGEYREADPQAYEETLIRFLNQSLPVQP